MTSERDANIALWGPTSAGKSWMIRALSWELAWYNQRDPEFHYRVVGASGQVYSWQPPTGTSVPATMDPVDREIQFNREPKRNSTRHRVSAFMHRLVLHDNAGLNLVKALHSPGMDAIVETTFEFAPYVIAVLDPTTLPRVTGSASASATVNPSSGMLTSVSEYLDSINTLCHFLVRAGSGKKYLAVCLNKVDMLGWNPPPQQILRMIFGQAMQDVLDGYHAQIDIKVFATSSVGYYIEHGERKPNITAQGEIAQPNSWQPCVAAPFFWIFEHKERERLARSRGIFSSSLDDYYPYPPPRRC